MRARTATLYHDLEEQMGSAGMRAVLTAVRRSLEDIRAVTTPTDETSRLTVLRAENEAKLAALRSEVLRDACSSDDVRRFIPRSRPTINRMARDGELLAIRDGRALRFPPWQFDSRTEDGLLPGLARVLGVMDASPFRKAAWFLSKHPRLANRTPLEVLRAGRIDDVFDEARALTPP